MRIDSQIDRQIDKQIDMYTYIHTCIYTCIHTHTHTHTHIIHTYIHTHAHLQTHICVCTFVCVRLSVYACERVHARACAVACLRVRLLKLRPIINRLSTINRRTTRADGLNYDTRDAITFEIVPQIDLMTHLSIQCRTKAAAHLRCTGTAHTCSYWRGRTPAARSVLADCTSRDPYIASATRRPG